MTMKSVAIIGTRGYPSFYGGFETLVRNLAPYMADRGWDVTVYGQKAETVDPSVPRHPAVQSIPTWGLTTRSLDTLSRGLTAAIHTAGKRPDVALVMNVANGYWLPLLRAAGVRICVNVDGIEWDRAKWGPLAKRVFRGGANLTARYSDELVVDSKEIGRRWQAMYGRCGVYIPYGGHPHSTECRLPDGLSRRKYVLMVARFVPENTVQPFFEAARKLCQHWPVVIVGSAGFGNYLDGEAARLAAESENVRWLGHLRDDRLLFTLWKHAGCYFHGHSVGGTNPALVQAMHSGAPICARNTTYNREVLGSCGKFVDPTADSIVGGITAMMCNNEEADRLGERAVARAAELYSWTNVCRSYEQLAEDLLQSSVRRSKFLSARI
jgi:glycosyltransferase involved in cell wall biosynthesis